jgi:glycosyltransferase involved in cell wall biosynthesis
LPHRKYVAVAPAMALYTPAGRRSLLEPFVFACGLFWALLRSQEDVWDVASFPYISVPVARVMSVVKRRPLVVTWLEYWGDYWYEYLGRAGIIGKLFEALALRCSPRIVVLSEFTKRRLVAAGARDERIVIVPNGVDAARVADVAPSRQSTDLVYVGRLLAHKQVHLLIEATRLLRERRPDATLLIIGDGPERPALERLAATLALRESVRFVGQLRTSTEVYAHLKASRVLALPSKREGFGTVVLEAWACGIPVVVCDEPENAAVELVDSPVKGRIVASNPRALAAACEDLLARDSSRSRGELHAAAARYDWKVIAAELARVYRAAGSGSAAAFSRR